MAGLNDAVFDLQLPNTKISLNYAAEKLSPERNFEGRFRAACISQFIWTKEPMM
jgi:hypothetical protein